MYQPISNALRRNRQSAQSSHSRLSRTRLLVGARLSVGGRGYCRLCCVVLNHLWNILQESEEKEGEGFTSRVYYYLFCFFFSPRRRSKTPERGEKFKRNVHFQDEEKYDENNARESSNSDERNRQDTREIVHPDGKVMFNWQNRSNWNLLLLPNGMLVHGSNLSPVWNISLAVGNMALEPKLPIQPELIPVSTLWSDNEIFYFP